MPLALIWPLLLKYGPTAFAYAVKFGPDAIKLLHQVHTLIESGKTDLTTDEMAQLLALTGKKPDDYLDAAGVPPTITL